MINIVTLECVSKKHPQDCLYYTIFNNCKHGDDSCKFLHRKNASNHVDIDKYKALEEKYNAILEDYKRILIRIEALECKEQHNHTSKTECTRTHGDVKRKIDSQEKDEVVNVTEGINQTSKKNKIDDTLVDDDQNKGQQMEVETAVYDNKVQDKPIQVFQKVERELYNIQNTLAKERKMTVKSAQRIKGMMKNIEKDYNLDKKTDLMFKRSYNKIEKAEISNFKNVTSDELQTLKHNVQILRLMC